MAKKINVKSGNASIEFDQGIQNLVDDLLSAALPETKKIIDSEFQKIFDNAKRNWPVRQAGYKDRFRATVEKMRQGRKASGKSTWTWKQALAVAHALEEKNQLKLADVPSKAISENSKAKLQKRFRIQGDELIIEIVNTAPYAWAIKAGRGSTGNTPYRKRVSNELLWKPVRKSADKIAQKLAADLMREIK
tara:strand:- start:2396 stop:2968 length:573 start_codon:yes stop_codon:yes gene_type:complete